MNDSLIINGTFYSPDNLRDFAISMTEDQTKPQWEKQIYHFITDWLSDSQNIVTYTSGTTGNRKVLMLDKAIMRKSAAITGDFFNLKKNDTALLCLPAQYIAGKMMIVRAFTSGLDLHITEPDSNPVVQINTGYIFSAMLPLQVFNAFETPGGKEKLNLMQHLIIGGADIHPGLLEKIKTLRNQTWHTYGMTETITHVAVRKINTEKAEHNFKALPGIEFSLDKRGCLLIQAPHISSEPVITDDLADLIDPLHFTFLGRYDNMVNSGGIKIIPEVLEKILCSEFSNRFILAGVPDEKLGEKLVFIAEHIQPENRDEFKRKAIEIFNSHLKKHEIPKEILFTDLFEENENGKIIRKRLKLDNF